MSRVIRQASIADLDILVALNAQVQALHVELEPSRFLAEPSADSISAFWRETLAQSWQHVLLAFTGETPQGYVWFEVQDRAATPFISALRRIYVHHLAVDALARRRGVAGALMRCIEAEAKALGVTEVALDCWNANSDAQAFFRAAGFLASRTVLGKSL